MNSSNKTQPLPNPFPFTNHPIIRRYIFWVIDRIVKP